MASSSPQPAPAAMKSQLVVTSPTGQAKTIELSSPSLSLGRSNLNDLAFPEEPGLSRRHAIFEKEGGQWFLVDLGSRNGTFLNGERVAGRNVLRSGDRVTASRIEIVYEAFDERRSSGVFEPQGVEASPVASETTLLHKILGEEQLSTRMGPQRSGWTSPVTALIRAGRELAVPRPLGELFKIILDLATEAVGAERGVLMTLEDGRLAVKAQHGTEFQLSQGVQSRVMNERLSLIVRDTRVEGEWQAQQSIISQGIRSLMAAPLQTDERVIGLLYLDSPGWARQFTSQDLELLTVMANIAAMRIERERLAEVERANQRMETELCQAAEIQQQCLPATPPQVPGLDLAGYTLPCRTVGGDYFDYFQQTDGRLCVVVADVAGKGMPAALLMMNLQARVQILAQDRIDPAVMMDRLNRSLIGICPSNRFITAFLCAIDPRSGYTSYCNAGHERALLIRADGRVEELGVGGPVAGLLTDIGYELGECMLQPGDSLVIFSDGATEARDPRGEEFGPQRIAAACSQVAGVDARTQIRHVNEAILAWLAGQPAHDDLTVVTMVKKAAGG